MDIEWNKVDDQIYLHGFGVELEIARLVNNDGLWELFIGESPSAISLLAETEEEAKEEALYQIESHCEEEIRYYKELKASVKELMNEN